MIDLFNEDDNQSFNYYTVKKGDSLWAIAKDNNVSLKLLAALNGINPNDYIYPDQVLIFPNKGYSYYITKEGDTLNLVSDTFQTDNMSIVKQNPTIYLQEGQLIVNKIS